MSVAEQEAWLLAEKNFILVGTDEKDRIYKDTCSSLDEDLWLSDSSALYSWNYDFNPAISTTKGTDYIMSKSLSLSLARLTEFSEKDEEDPNVFYLELWRMKYGQLMTLGGVYEDKEEIFEYACAELIGK
jgi:hypothetical protein